MNRDDIFLGEYLEEYEGFYSGRTAVILASGSTAPEDFRRTPRRGVLFGINTGALIIPNLDFIYYLDGRIEDIVRTHPAKKIGKNKKFEDHIYAGIIPQMGNSGKECIFAADFMGFDSIYVCGMDGFSGKREYWHSSTKENFRHVDNNYVQHLESFRNMKTFLKRPENIKFFNEDLRKIYQ